MALSLNTNSNNCVDIFHKILIEFITLANLDILRTLIFLIQLFTNGEEWKSLKANFLAPKILLFYFNFLRNFIEKIRISLKRIFQLDLELHIPIQLFLRIFLHFRNFESQHFRKLNLKFLTKYFAVVLFLS